MPSHPSSWDTFLKAEFSKEYFISLSQFIEQERMQFTVYPKKEEVFKAFESSRFENVKVVILGQDPYHGPNQANGLCFSVSDGLKLPRSLANIFKELQADLGIPFPISGDLSHWARKGVFLLNSTLTVREKAPGSHQNKGWEIFTDQVIKFLSSEKNKLVFILWGKFALAKQTLIDTSKHTVLTAAHPSPFSARKGFFGCKHFSRTNKILEENKSRPIQWSFD